MSSNSAEGSITVPAELAGAGAQLRTYSAALEDELRALRSLVADLAFTWQGAAQDSYQEYQYTWDQAADGLFGTDGVLTRIGLTTDLVNENYFDAEAANTKSWHHSS